MNTILLFTGIDVTSTSTVLGSILGAALLAISVLYYQQIASHKSQITAKDVVIASKDLIIIVHEKTAKDAVERLIKEQEYIKEMAVKLVGVVKDNGTAVTDLTKSTDKLDVVIQDIKKHQEETLRKNQEKILNNQDRFIEK